MSDIWFKFKSCLFGYPFSSFSLIWKRNSKCSYLSNNLLNWINNVVGLIIIYSHAMLWSATSQIFENFDQVIDILKIILWSWIWKIQSHTHMWVACKWLVDHSNKFGWKFCSKFKSWKSCLFFKVVYILWNSN